MLKGAAILNMGADGQMKVIQAGTNGWTCMDPGGAPMCADESAMEWAKAWKSKGPAPQKLGFIYMLNGDNGASNTSRTDVSETLAPLDLDAYALDAALRKALKLSERWLAMPPVELKSLVQEIVDRITVAADRIEIQLSRAKIAAALQVGERGQRPDLDPVVLSIEAKVRRAGKGKRLVIGNGAEAEVNAGLVEMIKEAFAIRNQFLSGSHDSIEAMSGRHGWCMNSAISGSKSFVSMPGMRAPPSRCRSTRRIRTTRRDWLRSFAPGGTDAPLLQVGANA